MLQKNIRNIRQLYESMLRQVGACIIAKGDTHGKYNDEREKPAYFVFNDKAM